MEWTEVEVLDPGVQLLEDEDQTITDAVVFPEPSTASAASATGAGYREEKNLHVPRHRSLC